jgi:hypothetical protein
MANTRSFWLVFLMLTIVRAAGVVLSRLGRHRPPVLPMRPGPRLRSRHNPGRHASAVAGRLPSMWFAPASPAPARPSYSWQRRYDDRQPVQLFPEYQGGGPDSCHMRSAAAAAWVALNYSIFCTDIAGFGDLRRNDDDRRVVREVLYRILQEAFEAANIPWAACRHEDRGDGTLTLVPPTVPTMPLVDPLVALLAAKIKMHNRQAGDPVRIELRAALHMGPVFHDANGICGHALNHTARMLDAPVLKRSLTASQADLAFIASAHVYDTVVRHATGLVDPTTFQPVRVQTKESETTGWMHLGGHSAQHPTLDLSLPTRYRLASHERHRQQAGLYVRCRRRPEQ